MYSPVLMTALLHHLCEAVSYGQRGVDESLHTAHQAGLCPVVQLRAWTVHTLVPADVCETVNLQSIKKEKDKLTKWSFSNVSTPEVLLLTKRA